MTRIYFRDLEGHWHTLTWEHAPSLEMPLSEDALTFARKLAASKYRYPDDRIAIADLLERWKLGLATTPAERAHGTAHVPRAEGPRHVPMTRPDHLAAVSPTRPGRHACSGSR